MAVKRWDPTPYPDARKREVLPGQADGATVTAPRAVTWMFGLREITDGAVRTAVSRKFNGPVFIRSCSFDGIFFTSAAAIGSALLRYSGEGGGDGFNGFSVVPPTGVDLFSTSANGPGNPTLKWPNGYSPVHSTNNALNGLRYIDLNTYVNLPEVFLKATLYAATANVSLYFGTVLLYEAVDPLTMFELMG